MNKEYDINNIKLKNININNIEENINPFNKAQLYRLQKWKEEINLKTGNRNLDYALNMINNYSTKLNLDQDTKNKIYEVYKESINKKLLSGRSIEYLVASSIYVGLRLDGVVRTSAEVSEICKIGEKELLRTSRVICKELGVKLPLLTPQDFVPRFSEALGVSKDVEDKVYSLLEDCEVVGLTNGPSPTSMCAVCLYIACNQCDERRTQRDIGDVCGITDVTIRNRLKKVKEVLDINL